MNIEKAKAEIKRSIRAYRKRSTDQTLQIPLERQRPLLMIGPPGIGKTAIMKQIAEETGEGLVAYSMTHHTRQSAIGLPMLEKKNFDGEEFTVTEYTMSEMLASLYDYMEKSGKRSGILFLDEINCVSETLTPVMLQLLQNKMFGTHALPEGWMIVAAGNPPEYNRSVREFDMASMDRVRTMDIEPDLKVWMDYAHMRKVHPAILIYLTIYPEHFYIIKEEKHEQQFVTARGWEDLSLMLVSYEEDGEYAGEETIREYIRCDEVAQSFSKFYQLFIKSMDQSLIKDRTVPAQRLYSSLFGDSLQEMLEKEGELSESEYLYLEQIMFAKLQAQAHKIINAQEEISRQKEQTQNEIKTLKAHLQQYQKILMKSEDASMALRYFKEDVVKDEELKTFV